MIRRVSTTILALVLLVLPFEARAELPWQTDLHTRYMALGDSLAAGFGAVPATRGYVYMLYRSGVYDTVPNTLLVNAGVSGATSADVLAYQVPQAVQVFHPTEITLSVGGNDLLRVLNGADPAQVLGEFQTNLIQILSQLRAGLPTARIIMSNQYTIPEIPGADQLIVPLNQIIEGVAAAFGVEVADVHGAFLGRTGLLLIERHDADIYNVHPTNAGYRVMAECFIEAARS